MINQCMVYTLKLYTLIYIKTGICLYQCEVWKKNNFVHLKAWVAPHYMRKVSFCFGFLSLLTPCTFGIVTLFRVIKISSNGSHLNAILTLILALVSLCLGMVCMISIMRDVNDVPSLVSIGVFADNYLEGNAR